MQNSNAREGFLVIRNVMNTVERMRQGQENLDWMKKEVEDTVSRIVGFVHQTCDSTRREIQADISSGNCIWHVYAVVNCMNRERDNVTISCNGKICSVGDVVAYRHKDNYPFHVEYIQDVFESLEDFVQGMIKLFPYIVESQGWKALMRAANVARV